MKVEQILWQNGIFLVDKMENAGIIALLLFLVWWNLKKRGYFVPQQPAPIFWGWVKHRDFMDGQKAVY